MNNEKRTIAYIIGNAFETIAQLPDVYTVNQFFSAILINCLPKHRLWIVGQGIHVSVREILSLCEKYCPELHLHFGSLASNEKLAEQSILITQHNEAMQAQRSTESQKNLNQKESKLEWSHVQFISPNRVKADLKLTTLSDEDLLTHDFTLMAARELSEKACHQSLPNGKLIIKTVQLHHFHRFFPLPITVEMQFQLVNDNKRSLKSLTRFYQDYACTAEAHLSFDLYSELEAKKLLQSLGEKTFMHCSENLEKDM